MDLFPLFNLVRFYLSFWSTSGAITPAIHLPLSAVAPSVPLPVSAKTGPDKVVNWANGESSQGQTEYGNNGLSSGQESGSIWRTFLYRLFLWSCVTKKWGLSEIPEVCFIRWNHRVLGRQVMNKTGTWKYIVLLCTVLQSSSHHCALHCAAVHWITMHCTILLWSAQGTLGQITTDCSD